MIVSTSYSEYELTAATRHRLRKGPPEAHTGWFPTPENWS